MTKTLLIAGAGLLILASGDVTASVKGRLNRDARTQYASDRLVRYGRHYVDRMPAVDGARGRKYVRRFSLRYNLENDKLRIYEQYGYTPHRLGFNVAGRRTERWKYYSIGKYFLFDEEGHLIETRSFPPEGNHID